MSIAIKVSPAVQVRRLKATHAYLSEKDIATLTGIDLNKVKAALASEAAGKRIKK
ncbi:hypothetical protein SAMN05216456_1886 [Devosia crocina]|uniref:DNA-binding protein n=1 Tax=Devosia crocina TaxID=429728 RepID=A0A1I7NEL5_9HYPH|nr:hypothetical protein [Devosia crocina]SFV33105.1 hypothetical protein SAMN05216456_1886 [Devosia crocina]